MAGFKYIFHQTICLAQAEPIMGINSDDASGILSTMLEHHQCIINRLVYRHKTGDTDNTAHVVFSSKPLPPR